MVLRGSLVQNTEKVIVQFGILDWEAAHERFGLQPGADVYFDEGKFEARVIWYLVQGLYKIYLAPIDQNVSQIHMCEQVWTAQGNNSDGEKPYPQERSFSMGDIVVFSNGTVWVCVSKGWHCLNVGVI